MTAAEGSSFLAAKRRPCRMATTMPTTAAAIDRIISSLLLDGSLNAWAVTLICSVRPSGARALIPATRSRTRRADPRR